MVKHGFKLKFCKIKSRFGKIRWTLTTIKRRFSVKYPVKLEQFTDNLQFTCLIYGPAGKTPN